VNEPTLGDKLTVLINDIAIAMKFLDYALYRGTIYKKCEKSKFTFLYKCDVGVFIHSLAANESFKSRLLANMKKVIDILSDVHCEVIRPIVVDYNLIEVSTILFINIVVVSLLMVWFVVVVYKTLNSYTCY
jgi:hypothetical protein